MQAKIIERVVADLRAQSYRHGAQATDAALVDAFLAGRDQAAFAALVQRHGPMVLGVCRRILGHAQDAEDAFQAAFWVLARKANTVRPRGHVGNWLYGVAVRTALKARGLRRRRREHQVDAMPPQTVSPIETNHDVHAILDEEIERLPRKYRLAVVLCELEGRGRKETAVQLGIAEGTLSSRLAYARKLLAKRLHARGVTLAAGGVALNLSEAVAGAAVPQSLLASTLQAASAAAPHSTAVASLVKGVLTAMFLSKLKQLTTITVLCALALGFGFGTRQLWADAEAQDAPKAQNDAPRAQNAAPPEQAAPAPALAQPNPAAKADPEAKDSILGLWRVLQIDSRPGDAGGEGGGSAPGQRGGVAGPMGIGPMGGGFSPMGGMSVPAVFDDSRGRAYLQIGKDEAVFTGRNQKMVYQIKLGAGTLDYRITANDETISSQGMYVLDGTQLRLYFGRQHFQQKAGPKEAPPLTRPKGPKDAVEIWTLIRPPTRQQIYQKLDQLQGVWKAVSGECNGEAFLPRELQPVGLTIKEGHWRMTPPHQPGQPDAVPRRFFNAEYEFVLDSDGPRNLLIVQGAGQRPMQQRVLYELRGDELKVCWSTRWSNADGGAADTPKEFKTAPGSELVMFVLQRVKSKSDPTAQPPGSPSNPGDSSPTAKQGDIDSAPVLVLKVHEVADLVSRDVGKEATTLMQVISKTIEPASWDLVGGSGTIEFFAEGKCLVIRQREDVQVRIGQLLELLRIEVLRSARSKQQNKSGN